MKGEYIVLFNISNFGVHPATDDHGFLLTFAEYAVLGKNCGDDSNFICCPWGRSFVV